MDLTELKFNSKKVRLIVIYVDVFHSYCVEYEIVFTLLYLISMVFFFDQFYGTTISLKVSHYTNMVHMCLHCAKNIVEALD